MYCYIQYIEVCKPEIIIPIIAEDMPFEESAPLQSVSSLTTTTSKLMVNPNCPVQILLDYICSEIGIDKDSTFDLCDLETIEMVGIKQLKPWCYATNILKSKHTYIFVFYEKDEYGQYTKVDPYINQQARNYSETLLKIMKHLNISKKPNGTRNKHGSTSSKGSTDSHKDPARRKINLNRNSSKLRL